MILTSFILLSFLALGFILWPLRQHKKIVWIIPPVLMVFIAVSYWYFGGWIEWQKYLRRTAEQERIQAVLQSIKSPQELINKLTERLQHHPNSAKGWYLLGRLYVSQGELDKAYRAFHKAHSLKPQDTLITVNYAQTLLQRQNENATMEARRLLQRILDKHPDQPDALALLAMDAYQHHAYQKAIDYWQRLLLKMPAQSEEAAAIRRAIAKAQKQSS